MSQEPAAGGFSPMGLGDILGGAFKQYAENWQRLLLIVAVITVPMYLIVDLLVSMAFDAAVTTETTVIAGQTVQVPSVNSAAVGSALALTFVASAIAVVVGFIVQAAIARGAAASIAGGGISVEAAYAFGLKRLGSFIWIAILVGVIVGLAPVVLIVLFAFIAPLLLALLVPAAIVYMIFVGTMLAVTIPALVVENKRGTEALSRSWELVKGHFWHVFGTILVAMLIAGFVAGVIGGIFGGMGGINGNWVMRWIGDSLAAIITTPFTALVAVLLYVDVRVRRESLTVEGLRQELAADA